MPFRDEDWEELQRDCDTFPAYSDYLYGPDRRLVVTQEPGLHPLIYPTPTPQPAQNYNGMPINSSDPRRRLRTMAEKEDSRRRAMSQQHDCAHVPPTSRRDAYPTPIGVTQQQYHTHNHATPAQQIQHHQPSAFMLPTLTQMPSSTLWPSQNSGLSHTVYPIVQPSFIFPEISGAASHQASAQLRAHINPHIPQFWHCLQLAIQNHVQTSQATIQEQHRAQQWIQSFEHSLPPQGRIYLAQVVARMNVEKAAGRDPLISFGFRA